MKTSETVNFFLPATLATASVPLHKTIFMSIRCMILGTRVNISILSAPLTVS